ncbi:HIT domain-containing protein [Streptomyces sp. NPDC046374]|uniref:HIT domain-containing protein n=1 Tax=Streptomyces sp. NPDC046374 TaxID=3154917 RepID=UPI0033EE4A78
MDCQFCTEFTTREHPTRIITETPGSWLLLPTVGAFTPGYCLFMPVEHLDAAADLTPAHLRRVAAEVEEMRTLIQNRYGPTILAEHGPRDCELGASCCSHCHLHLIPVPDPDVITAAYERSGGPGRRLGSMAELPTAADGSYLYLSPRHGEHHYWPSAGFARQFVRRVCADALGIGDSFDWRDHPFTTHRERTFAELSSDLHIADAACRRKGGTARWRQPCPARYTH